MLQIKDIRKQYITGDLIQNALDGVALSFRDNEFVAVLGPSGSGKTTLLNIIGGLDRYDSGDLIINGISTKKYSDRDWDTYRNHTIGFVFQSYNLIPHQSVLANVELALTISGISKVERRKRSIEALKEVGLGDQYHKKPTQMSGGQMQRVAIARALVNDPDILLADEPTGALDSETSMQVMDLLKKVAKERLVIMVTHNTELAETCATRIVKLSDGIVLDDSDPFEANDVSSASKNKSMGKASMSFRTSLTLSFNNLRTKKGRTILTAFAGSIGIIGIALIISLSSGVNIYISNVQKETMTSYPIVINSESIDLRSLMSARTNSMGGNVDDGNGEKSEEQLDRIYADNTEMEASNAVASSVSENNLSAFKKYLDDPKSEIRQYLGENGVSYSYDVRYDVYAYDTEGQIIKTVEAKTTDNNSLGLRMDMMSSFPGANSSSNFEQLLPGNNEELISPVITKSYSLVYGNWPNNYDEVVLVLDKYNAISTTALYKLGLLPNSEYEDITQKIKDGQKVDLAKHDWSYKDACNRTFYLIPISDYYVKNSNGTFDNIGNNELWKKTLVDSSIKLKVVGAIRPAENAKDANLTSPVGYTAELTDYMIAHTNNSAVVIAQESTPKINVLTGISFNPKDDDAKIADTISYISGLNTSEKASMFAAISNSGTSHGSTLSGEPVPSMTGNMSETQLAWAMDRYLLNPNDDVLLAIYNSYISGGNYEDNMSSFGKVSYNAPSSISIYVDSFEDKNAITGCISTYNDIVEDKDKITYTDYVGLLMSTITSIVDVISYVLIAFVAVSLIVSCIMIGIITNISVLERTKEIGILRAIGASTRNISQVFNAETFIVGLFSGMLGVGLSCLLLIPGNAIIQMLINSADISAALPITSAMLLILLSVILTLVSGLIPARSAAKKDPVIALRSE